MRLDKFLQIARLIKRRAVAKEVCLAGRVMVNGRTAKPGLEVKEGDVLSLKLSNRRMEVEILAVSAHPRVKETELIRFLKNEPVNYRE